MTSESKDIRLKRLAMRSMRRGIKEMDLILSAYAEANLATLDDAGLDLYEALLDENDQDLYQWVSRQAPAPDRLAPLVDTIAAMAEGLTAPR